MLLPPQRRRSLFDYKIVAAYLAGTSSGAILTALVAWILSGFTEPLSDGIRAALLIVGGVFVWTCKHGPLASVIALPEARRRMNPLEDARQALQKAMDKGNTFLGEAYSEIHEAGPRQVRRAALILGSQQLP